METSADKCCQRFETIVTFLIRSGINGNLSAPVRAVMTTAVTSLIRKEQKIKDLLEMAIQWNSAKFDDFGKTRSAIDKKAQERTQQCWWTAYEAAYLAVIRLEQGNNVEALFHSFRSVEGLLRDIAGNKDRHEGIRDLIERALPDWELSEDIQIFKYHTANQRNNLFHNLLGLTAEQVFQAWNQDTTKNPTKDIWRSRVLGCLNFISKEKFTSLKKASLMSEVHKELKDTIDNYELQN